MFIKPLKNERLVLVGYEGGKLFLWDLRQRSILSSLTIETCPMALDFDSVLMKGIIGGPSNQLQVKYLILIKFCNSGIEIIKKLEKWENI